MAVTGPRPPSRPWHAVTRLDHFAIVSYPVDPHRLAGLLPDGFEPHLLPVGSDGDEPISVVSAVVARNRRFRFRGLPVTMSAGQVDYRAYVTVDGEHGVWFFGASLDSPLVAVARGLWSMPWHRAAITVDGEWTGDGLDRLTLAVSGPWGGADVALTAPGPGPDALAPFGEVTDPLVGWYRTRRGGVRRYRVWHPPLALRPASVDHASFEVFTDLGLVERGRPPLSVLVQRQVDLDVHTPPRRYRPAPSASSTTAGAVSPASAGTDATEASGRTGAARQPRPRA